MKSGFAGVVGGLGGSGANYNYGSDSDNNRTSSSTAGLLRMPHESRSSSSGGNHHGHGHGHANGHGGSRHGHGHGGSRHGHGAVSSSSNGVVSNGSSNGVAVNGLVGNGKKYYHHHHHSSRHHRRTDESEVSCCLKYLIFGFNVIFWLIGLFILTVGVWAWSEKETLSNLTRLTRVALDPAFIFILVGSLTFVITFTGFVGALRENTCLLAVYAIFLAAILLLEIATGILGFIFKDWIKGEATSGFQSFIVSYREDPDQQNLIDWIQERWLQCCGIEGPRDWDKNVYFNCNSSAREACGVPFSCCKAQPLWLGIRNTQCGYDVRKPEYPQDRSLVIYDKGCLRSGEEWIEQNLIPVAAFGVAVAIFQTLDASSVIHDQGCLAAAEEWLQRNLVTVVSVIVVGAFLQILGICFAQNLRADVFAQRSKWR